MRFLELSNSETESRRWVPRAGGGAMRVGELVFSGCRVSAGEDRWWCWLHDSVNVLKAMYLKKVEMVNFLLYVYFTTIKKKPK